MQFKNKLEYCKSYKYIVSGTHLYFCVFSDHDTHTFFWQKTNFLSNDLNGLLPSTMCKTLSFDDSNSYCDVYYNSTLASVHNDAIASEILLFIGDYQTNASFWIGLRSHILTRNGSNFFWIDGTSYYFNEHSRWDLGSPNRNGKCGIVMQTGQWRDISCHIALNGFFCGKSKKYAFIHSEPSTVFYKFK